jgi:hypothetical protein
MHGPGWIEGFAPFVHGFVVLPIKGFISKGPDNDTGMVPVAPDHLLDTINVRILPLWVVRGKLRGSAKEKLFPLLVVHRLRDAEGASHRGVETVTFKVSLIYYVKTELVAEIVKARMGGIMRAAESVDVMAFHQEEVVTNK